ncbi:MAG: PRC-barrel domain protein [Firmicutes bacterium]|nr:PRC-barrel domain protein [Bacillota bacterium]
MNKTADIINLPVIDISEGAEIGIATKIIINPIEGSIAALVIDDGKWYLGAKLLPFAEIAGLGESAITIINKSAILTIENAPALEQLLSTDVTVIGTKVLTKTGRIQGTVKEIFVDNTGKIIACEIEELNGEFSSIPVERIMTFGKKVLIVADETEITTEAANTQMLSTPEIKTPETVQENTQENTNDDSAKKFDEKQRKYLLGKRANRRIETDNGVVIVEQGGEINEEVLQKAKLAGKFVELSMNIQ